MLEQLLKILEADCKNFDLQFKKGQYRLVLDGDKDFTGTDIDKVLNDAVDWLDSQDYVEGS